MPTYEYSCGQCGHGFEIFQSIRAERLATCPSCGQSALKRLIGTGGGIIFKGSGFYQTDYKKPAANGSDSPEASKTGSDKSRENKPAPPTPSKSTTSEVGSAS